jgi:BioD-like phosphotransacetylase family protein
VRAESLASFGNVNETPIIAKNLNAAKIFFMTCGLSAERAAALRAEVTRNEVAAMDTVVDEVVAAQFRLTFPTK